jgi:hypothetical protein
MEARLRERVCRGKQRLIMTQNGLDRRAVEMRSSCVLAPREWLEKRKK